MSKYQITIKDDFFPHELTGEFVAETEEKAIEECKEVYAYELDTEPEFITIIKIIKI